MCLIKDTKYFISDFPFGGVGDDDGAAHVGTRYDFGGLGTAGCAVVVVEAHDHFGVAVVEGYGGDLDEDFGGAWIGHGRGGLREVLETILVGDPLLDFGWERHV